MRIYKYEECEYTGAGYDVQANGRKVPLHGMRVSAYPFNRRWPGKQRDISQSKPESFISIGSDDPVEMVVRPKFSFKNATIRPQSAKIQCEIKGDAISFLLPGPINCTLEIDGCSNALHIFVDPEKNYSDEIKGEIIYYGRGFHDAGNIELKSNQTLFIDEGAVVYACVFAKNAENISVIGTGILDNSKNREKILFSVKEADGLKDVKNAERQHTVQLEYCKNVHIEGIIIRDSLLYNIRPICCENININRIKIIGCWRYNSDGIDMHNCKNVLIENCFIRTFDDCICVKGFDFYQDERDMLHEGRLYDEFSDAVIKRCVIWNDWGKALEIGAETRAKKISGIRFCDCDIIHSTACALDVANVDYAEVSDIIFEDIRIECDEEGLPVVMQKNDEHKYSLDTERLRMPLRLMAAIVKYHPEFSAGGAERGKIHDVTFKNIKITGATLSESYFSGHDKEHGVNNIFIENVSLNGKKIENEKQLNLKIGKYAENIFFDGKKLI